MAGKLDKEEYFEGELDFPVLSFENMFVKADTKSQKKRFFCTVLA